MKALCSALDDSSKRSIRDPREIVAIVVTFNPDIATFDLLLTETTSQVGQIVVVDNGSRSECVAQLQNLCAGRAMLHLLPVNEGIAAAQNHGVVRAREAGATDILLLDHDSVPEHGMVAALRQASDVLRDAGEAVAAVGPLVIDRQTLAVAPIPLIVDGVVRFVPPGDSAPMRCEYLIASGALIPLSAFDVIGPMNEAFFVDQVDVEWCSRAKAARLGVYCVPTAQMHHAIGDEVVRFWAFGWRNLAVHAPMRDYFYFRNSMRLIFAPHTVQPWRHFWTRRLVRLLLLQAVFAPPRWRRVCAMVSGAWAAIAERYRSNRAC